MNIRIKKRNGKLEDFDVEKVHQIVNWACEGINGVNFSDVEMNAELALYDKIPSTDIHQILIDSANDLISEEEPNYQYVAAKLLNFKIRKDVWGGHTPPRLYDHIKDLVKLDLYDSCIIKGMEESYSKDEINKLGEYIKHDRDYLFTYSGLQQMVDKYLLKNRNDGTLYETPQFAYMLIAMVLFMKYGDDRLQRVKDAYDYFSTFKINLPTPVMSGVRTKIRQFASCVLVDVGDSLDSITSSVSAVAKYTARRAGIGLNVGRIRPINSPIRGGEVIHTGLIPYLKVFESAVKATSQNGIRGGSATVNIPFWHYEIEDVLVLKNNGGTDDNRVRKLDYCIQFCKIFYERLIKDEDITLFSPAECEGLYDAFGHYEFNDLYLKYEKDNTLKFKKKIKARKLAELFARERLETGRIYVMNIDHCNQNGSWDADVKMTNLCVSGDQRVVSDRGLLTVEELYEQGGKLKLFDNKKIVDSSAMTKIEKNTHTFKITLSNGMTHTVTDYHKVLVRKNRHKNELIECKNLNIGDKVYIQTNKGLFGNKSMIEEAFLLGLYQSDGTQHKDRIMIDIWEYDFDLENLIQDCFDNIHYRYGCDKVLVNNQYSTNICYKNIKPAKFSECKTVNHIRKRRLCSKTLKKSLNFEKGYVPQWIWESDEATHWSYLKGLLYADGSATLSNNVINISYMDTNYEFLQELQILCNNLGLNSKIYLGRDTGSYLLPDGKGGQKYYECKTTYRLVISNKEDALEIEKHTGFLSRKNINLDDRKYRKNTKKCYDVINIEYVGKQDVYCVTVYSDEHLWVCNGFITSNCVEITHPTKPLEHIDDEEAEIGICILSAINMLEINNDTELQKACEIVIRLLNALIDYQDYPILAGQTFTLNRRSLGVGITNLAGFLAKNKLSYYSQETLEILDEYMEKLQYYLLDASCQMAEESGACPKFNETKYARGLMPYDWANENARQLVKRKPSMDWDGLAKRIQEFGLKNSTVSAIMPCESSSVIQNSTNGIEPVRRLLTYKKAKNGMLKQLVPAFHKNRKYYDLAFNFQTNKELLNIVATLQKWVDMSISTNNYYNYTHYEGGSIPLSVLIKDLVYAYKVGVKTLYYANSPDGDIDATSGCDGGGCSI